MHQKKDKYSFRNEIGRTPSKEEKLTRIEQRQSTTDMSELSNLRDA
jgi:hypothetical protein